MTIFFISLGQLAYFILIIQDEHCAIHPKYFHALIYEGSNAIVEYLRAKKRARAQKIFCHSSVGPSCYSSLTSLALSLILIIQLCDWKRITLSYQRTPLHFFGYIYAPFFELMLLTWSQR